MERTVREERVRGAQCSFPKKCLHFFGAWRLCPHAEVQGFWLISAKSLAPWIFGVCPKIQTDSKSMHQKRQNGSVLPSRRAETALLENAIRKSHFFSGHYLPFHGRTVLRSPNRADIPLTNIGKQIIIGNNWGRLRPRLPAFLYLRRLEKSAKSRCKLLPKGDSGNRLACGNGQNADAATGKKRKKGKK